VNNFLGIELNPALRTKSPPGAFCIIDGASDPGCPGEFTGAR